LTLVWLAALGRFEKFFGFARSLGLALHVVEADLIFTSTCSIFQFNSTLLGHMQPGSKIA
jgi:hypothetical protein